MLYIEAASYLHTMTTFLAMMISSLAVYFVDGWVEPYLDVSIRMMLDLILSIAVYMTSRRYFINLRG